MFVKPTGGNLCINKYRAEGNGKKSLDCMIVGIVQNVYRSEEGGIGEKQRKTDRQTCTVRENRSPEGDKHV